MIIVAGHLRVAPAQRDRVLALSRDAVVLARATPGCLDFVVATDLIDAARVNVFERWNDREALIVFRKSGPEIELGTRIVEYFVKEFDVVVPGSVRGTQQARFASPFGDDRQGNKFALGHDPSVR